MTIQCYHQNREAGNKVVLPLASTDTESLDLICVNMMPLVGTATLHSSKSEQEALGTRREGFIDLHSSSMWENSANHRCKSEPTVGVWKDVLRRNWHNLKTEILPSEDLLSCLTKDKVLSVYDADKIRDRHTLSKKNDFLLQALVRGGQRAFDSLIQALEPDYSFLADRLEKEVAEAMRTAEEKMQAKRKRMQRLLTYFPRRVFERIGSFSFQQIWKCDTEKEILHVNVHHTFVKEAAKSMQVRYCKIDEGAKQNKTESFFWRMEEEIKKTETNIQLPSSVDKNMSRWKMTCSGMFSSTREIDMPEDGQLIDNGRSKNFSTPRTRDLLDQRNIRGKEKRGNLNEGRISGPRVFGLTRLCFALILGMLCTTSCLAGFLFGMYSFGELDAQILDDRLGEESFRLDEIFSNEILSNLTYRRPDDFFRDGMLLQAFTDHLIISNNPVGRFTKSSDEDSTRLISELDNCNKQQEECWSLESLIEVVAINRRLGSRIGRRSGRLGQKVKIKWNLPDSQISVQFSDVHAAWDDFCDNFTASDFHVGTGTKWVIQAVILCMTYIIAKQKLSGEFPTISCGKLSDSRWIFMLLLVACIFDPSSAVRLKVFKSSTLESVGKSQGSITELGEGTMSKTADINLCCKICEPSIMKMDCDRFCDSPCPKENDVKIEMKSSTENHICADVMKWILIISVIVLVILVAHMYYFSRVQSHLDFPLNPNNCVRDTCPTGQSQLNGFGCHLDTCWFFVAVQKLFPKCSPSNDTHHHLPKYVGKFLLCFFGGNHPTKDPSDIDILQEAERMRGNDTEVGTTRTENGIQTETEWIQSKKENGKGQLQQKNDGTTGNKFIDTPTLVQVGESDEGERNGMISAAVKNAEKNTKRLNLYNQSEDNNRLSTFWEELVTSLEAAAPRHSKQIVTSPDAFILYSNQIIEQSKQPETKQPRLEEELTNADAMMHFNGNVLSLLLTELVSSKNSRLSDIFGDNLLRVVKHSIKAEILRPDLQILQYRIGVSRIYFEKLESIMSKMNKIQDSNKQPFPIFLQQTCFTIPMGLRRCKRFEYFRKYPFENVGHRLMLSIGLKRKREQTTNSKQKKGKTSHITSCSDENDSQAENGELSSDAGQIPQAWLNTSQEFTDTVLKVVSDESLATYGGSMEFRLSTDHTLSERMTEETAADVPYMIDLKALKAQSMRLEDVQTESTCSMIEHDRGMHDYETTGNRCHDLPIRNSENFQEESVLPSTVTNRDSESGWKREENSIASLGIRVIQPLTAEATAQSREFVRTYIKLYEHVNTDKKSEDKDDCHALRRATWLSGEDLPTPSLDYVSCTVAVLHSEARKILERLANGEHIGAHESMKYEILRVCTYRNYPGEGKPFRIQLASAGWYFASDSDEVVCYCCGLRKSGWKDIDNPMKIHELLRPTCDFLVKRSEVNIPIPELPAERAAKFNIFESNTSDSTIQSRQGEGPNNYDSDSSNPQDRLFTPPPKHPQYAEKTTRLETFKKWPTNIPQTAQIMADCGYYYAGFGDCVRCFHCGIGLRHWTEDDYPWVEHARWSKNCAYLRLKKGTEFIHNVHLAIDNDEEPEDLVPETPSGRPADMSQAIPNEDSSQILLTDPAQSVLTMGYQPRIIKRAIDIILQKDGKPGITAQKIMETIFMLEERDAAVTSNLQEGLAKINISSASGGPDTQLKEAPNTSGGNAAIGQAHGRARTQGNDKAKKDQQKDVKHSSKEKRNDKEESNKKESNKAPQRHNEATAHSEEGGGSESKSKVKDTNKIKAENRKLKEQTVCKICLDKPVSIVFLPCGHLVTCAECAPAMRKCPICRALVKGRVKAFMS